MLSTMGEQEILKTYLLIKWVQTFNRSIVKINITAV